jgi:hypothetical protein
VASLASGRDCESPTCSSSTEPHRTRINGTAAAVLFKHSVSAYGSTGLSGRLNYFPITCQNGISEVSISCSTTASAACSEGLPEPRSTMLSAITSVLYCF